MEKIIHHLFLKKKFNKWNNFKENQKEKSINEKMENDENNSKTQDSNTKKNTLTIYTKNFQNNDFSFSNTKNLISNKNTKLLNNEKKEIYNYNDEELNELNYNDAILYDKRHFIQYYFDLLKRKQIILFTFFSNNDYNIFNIKLSLFFFSFSLYFAVNALFFEDNTMHKIYESKGNLNIIFQIPHIVYSTIISSVINIIVKYFSLSSKYMIRVKKIKDKNESLRESAKLLRILKIKFNIYFFISFIFLIFFLYFISAFCAVYKNTQIILIENTLSSFLLSLLYPFGFSLLPCIFRIPALRDPKKNLQCLYDISKVIAFL